MSGKLPLAEGEVSRTVCARVLVRKGVDEETGAVLSAAVLAERIGWCADLVAGMVGALVGGHWNATDVGMLASGVDAGGRKLPSNAWMALRRLGWTVTAPVGVKVNDRVVRMAQEQAGRVLRSVRWRADVAGGVLATWPAHPPPADTGHEEPRWAQDSTSMPTPPHHGGKRSRTLSPTQDH